MWPILTAEEVNEIVNFGHVADDEDDDSIESRFYISTLGDRFVVVPQEIRYCKRHGCYLGYKGRCVYCAEDAAIDAEMRG